MLRGIYVYIIPYRRQCTLFHSSAASPCNHLHLPRKRPLFHSEQSGLGLALPDSSAKDRHHRQSQRGNVQMAPRFPIGTRICGCSLPQLHRRGKAKVGGKGTVSGRHRGSKVLLYFISGGVLHSYVNLVLLATDLEPHNSSIIPVESNWSMSCNRSGVRTTPNGNNWVKLSSVREVITHQHLIARPMVQELTWDEDGT